MNDEEENSFELPFVRCTGCGGNIDMRYKEYKNKVKKYIDDEDNINEVEEIVFNQMKVNFRNSITEKDIEKIKKSKKYERYLEEHGDEKKALKEAIDDKIWKDAPKDYYFKNKVKSLLESRAISETLNEMGINRICCRLKFQTPNIISFGAPKSHLLEKQEDKKSEKKKKDKDKGKKPKNKKVTIYEEIEEEEGEDIDYEKLLEKCKVDIKVKDIVEEDKKTVYRNVGEGFRVPVFQAQPYRF